MSYQANPSNGWAYGTNSALIVLTQFRNGTVFNFHVASRGGSRQRAVIREILRFTIGNRFREVSLNVMTRMVSEPSTKFGLPTVRYAHTINWEKSDLQLLYIAFPSGVSRPEFENKKDSVRYNYNT